jgi:hypothetical protein
MNKDFIKELKALCKKYDYELLFKCCHCGIMQECQIEHSVEDYLTIVEKLEEFKK